MDIEEIQKLMKALEESRLKKIVLKQGDFELTLEKEGDVYLPPMSSMPQMHQMSSPSMVTSQHHALRGIIEESTHDSSQRSGGKKSELDGSYVTSPMVGTFYASSGPDQAAFVKVGDRVQEGTVVCIVEAMKVMNEVKAGTSGVIAEILANNGQPIEFGTKLFRVV
jgi:acetyl-CoA carboxylase biotin carboxyl carrier protein